MDTIATYNSEKTTGEYFEIFFKINISMNLKSLLLMMVLIIGQLVYWRCMKKNTLKIFG